MGLLDRAVDKLKEDQGQNTGRPAEPAGTSYGRYGRRRSEVPEVEDVGVYPGDDLDAEADTYSPSEAVTPAGPATPVRLDLVKLSRRGFMVPGFPYGKDTLDEYRRVKREVLFRAAIDEISDEQSLRRNLVMISSALDGEGKTFVSINLALSTSLEVDRTALLVDGDVIRRGTSKLLGLEHRPGLIDYLTGDYDDLSELLVRPEGIENLEILPAGSPNEHVNELLTSERMRELMDELALANPDRLAIIDSPPLLMANEAGVLAQHAGQIVLVVRADVTPQNSVDLALGGIPPERFTGLLLNRAARNPAVDGYSEYY